MSFSGFWLCFGLVACTQLYLEANAKRAKERTSKDSKNVDVIADSIKKAVIWEDGCCKFGCKKGRAVDAVPFCASRFTFWDRVHEGLRLQPMDDSVCRSVTRGEACDAQRLPETKLGFDTGSFVLWTKSDSDVPEGTLGTVVGFKRGDVQVRFPKGTWSVEPAELVKAQTPEANAPENVGFWLKPKPKPETPPTPIETLAWWLSQDAPDEDPIAVLAWWISKSGPAADNVNLVAKRKLVGKGWCRPSGCNKDEPTCRTNGFWKGSSSIEECEKMCAATKGCVGFGISSPKYSPGVPNTCMVHASGSVPSGWSAYAQKYHDVRFATGASEVQCFTMSGR